jgi:hypothetical protein
MKATLNALIDVIRAREVSAVAVDDVLGEISGALSDLVAMLDKPRDDGTAQAILAGLRAITIPAPVVNVAAPSVTVAAPSINVAAPSVTVQAPPQVKGWKLSVTARDGNGAIRDITMKPEY